MQMVLLVFRTSLEEEVLGWLEQEDVPYTRVDDAKGKGLTGHVPDGYTSFHGTNSIAFTIVPENRMESFREKITRLQDTMRAKRKRHVPFHAFVLPALQWV